MKIFSMSLFAVIFMAAANVSYGGGLLCKGRKSSEQKQCTSGQSSCQACSGQSGDCCYPGEAIDIDSLTDKAQSKQLFEAMQARLIFEVPEDIDVVLSGQKMTTGGKERIFLVSVNNQKSTYRYNIQVDAVRGGKMYYKKQQIKSLKAGAILKVTVAAPKVADGEIPEIAIAIEPIMPGGPPTDEKAAAAGDDQEPVAETAAASANPSDDVAAESATVTDE